MREVRLRGNRNRPISVVRVASCDRQRSTKADIDRWLRRLAILLTTVHHSTLQLAGLRVGTLSAQRGASWPLFFWSRTRTKCAFSPSRSFKRLGTPPYLRGPLNKHSRSSLHQN